MTYTKKGKIALMVGLIVIPVIFVSLIIVNWFIYPFSSATPNFADVEAVFSKLQIPADWQVIEETENSGIAGRQCPVESGDVCFNKTKIYSIGKDESVESITEVFKSSGCISPIWGERREYSTSKYSTDVECSSGALIVSGTLREADQRTISIRVRTN